MRVVLTPSEILMAATIGLMRHIASVKAGLPDRNGHEGAGWNLHIEGACGELAVAKGLGLYWTGGINTFKGSGDVGKIQVRTRSKPEYELIIRPDDDEDATFVLVTGLCPAYDIVGKIVARDGKRQEWLCEHGDRPPAWFVPQKALEPIP
jgi:hypothetical protein